MSSLPDAKRRIWFSSALDTVGNLGCTTCLAYLNGISKFSSLFPSPSGDAGVEQEGKFFVIDLQLHDSSPIFSDVFGASGSVSGGRYQGRCPSCGREFRYEYQPKSAHPGCLRVGCQSESNRIPPQKPKPQPVSRAARPSRPKRTQKPPARQLPPPPTEDVIPISRVDPSDFSEAQCQAHTNHLLGPPAGSEWAQRVEHKWTVRLDVTNVSFQDLIPTPQTLWIEIQSRPNMTLESEVIGLDRQTGEASFRSRDKGLIAANAHLALLRSKAKPKGYLGVANGCMAAMWQSEYQARCMSLTPARLVAAADFERNLIISTDPLTEAPVNWTDLSVPSAWHVKEIGSCGVFWLVEYHGKDKRLEVRRASDSQLMWHREYARDDKAYVSTDSEGWLVSFDGQIESYQSDGKLRASWRSQDEMLSLGSRYCVGRQPLGEGSIWGCPEPSLRVADRQSGENRTLPQELFPNRTCYTVSGDILWCVCENQKVLRAYNLHTRKVVRDISPLPSGPHSTHRSSKIQCMGVYGTDLYVVSKAGLILAFGEPG